MDVEYCEINKFANAEASFLNLLEKSKNFFNSKNRFDDYFYKSIFEKRRGNWFLIDYGFKRKDINFYLVANKIWKLIIKLSITTIILIFVNEL